MLSPIPREREGKQGRSSRHESAGPERRAHQKFAASLSLRSRAASPLGWKVLTPEFPPTRSAKHPQLPNPLATFFRRGRQDPATAPQCWFPKQRRWFPPLPCPGDEDQAGLGPQDLFLNQNRNQPQRNRCPDSSELAPALRERGFPHRQGRGQFSCAQPSLQEPCATFRRPQVPSPTFRTKQLTPTFVSERSERFLKPRMATERRA